GRTENNDIVLADVLVSRQHAVIQKRAPEELWLADLGSRNGTQLNGSRITRPILLRDKDEIDIGPYRLLFHQPKAPRLDSYGQTTLGQTVVQTPSNLNPPRGPPANP